METEMTVEPASSSGVGISMEEVIKLNQVFYSTTDPEQQTRANARLMEIQASPYVWDICWQLLDPNLCSTQEVQFFAANTIVLKLNQNWSQLPESWLRDELRPKLFEVLCHYTNSMTGYKLVTERLALALATLAVHSIPTFWPNAIEHIMHALLPTNLPTDTSSKRICDILLKILLFIPEEYSVLVPHQADRAKLNCTMTESGSKVFEFLYSLLISMNGDEAITPVIVENVLKCMTSWTLHSHTSILEMDNWKYILKIVYNLIQDVRYCSGACAFIAATFINQKAENYKQSILTYISKIAKLRFFIEQHKSRDELECATKVYSLVINFAENHSRLFLRIALNDDPTIKPELQPQLKKDVLDIIELITECSAAPGIFGVDENYSDMAFSFWFTFLENFYYFPDTNNDIICETFNPMIDALLIISLRKLCYPPSNIYLKVWSSDQRESFRCYRQDLGDNISLLIQFPRARIRLIDKLHKTFQEELRKLIGGGLINGEPQWQAFEAVIFALKSIAEAVPFDESEHLPDMFNMLNQIPFDESQSLLYCTVAEMISAYSDWLFAQHQHLGPAFDILFKGIQSKNQEMILFSTLSLKDLIRECQLVISPYAPDLIRGCSEAMLRPDSEIPTAAKIRLMYSLGTALPMSPGLIDSVLDRIAAPLIQNLQLSKERQTLIDSMVMLNSLVESFHTRPPGHQFDGEGDCENINPNDWMMPPPPDVIDRSLSLVTKYSEALFKVGCQYKHDEQITSLIAVGIKQFTKSLGTDLKPLVESIIGFINISYDTFTNTHLLDPIATLIILFKNVWELIPHFKICYDNIARDVVEKTREQPRGIVVSIENYFKFACQVCRRLPDFLIHSQIEITQEIYKLCLSVLEFPEKRAIAEVCSYILLFRSKTLNHQQCNLLFTSNADFLVSAIFRAFGGQLQHPRNCLEPVVDLLFQLLENDEIKESLRRVLHQDGFPTNYVDANQKLIFIQAIVHEKHRRKFKDTCQEFILLCRNLHRQ